MPHRICLLLLCQFLTVYSYAQLSSSNLPFLTGNYKVVENDKGQLVTTFDIYRSDGSALQKVYLGSPYLSFPVWQPGTINVDGKGEDVPCQIAYNLFTDEIRCRFPDSGKEIPVAPVAFTVNGVAFVSTPIDYLGNMARRYYAVFNAGPTRFLVNYRRQFADSFTRSEHREARSFDGVYVSVERYFIQKDNATPLEIKLTTESLLKALPEKAPQLRQRLRSKTLTKDEVVGALVYYDELMKGEVGGK
jgi:hypothetical protein